MKTETFKTKKELLDFIDDIGFLNTTIIHRIHCSEGKYSIEYWEAGK